MDRAGRLTSLRSLALFVGVPATFLFGLSLRLDSISAGLGLDEFGTLWVVERDFVTTLRRCWQFQGQSPLYYILPWMSAQIFGESETALRLPSLLLSVLLVPVVYLCARRLAGPRAGWYAAAFAWLAALSIYVSVDARPYVLVLFTVALAIAGFQWAVESGRRNARALWIVGGALVAWAHYVQYPVIAGLWLAYFLLPELRVRYRVRQFVLDGALQLAIVALCLPQVFALWGRRATLSWLDEWNYLSFAGPLLPLLPGILMGLVDPPRGGETELRKRALRRALLIALVFQVVALEALSLVGINLLTARYFMSIFVPGVLLAATGLARARRVEAAIAVVVFAAVTGVTLIGTKVGTGKFSGVGFEDWRGAVADLSARIRGERDPVVFFRSGFVEEDAPPLGSPPVTTLAPLRSPGRPAFPMPVTSLTFRWQHPLREAYFEEKVGPVVGRSERFFVISATSDWSGVSYPDHFIQWVETKWPGDFRSTRTSYGGVELLEFQRQTN